MEATQKQKITINTTINSSIEKVWEYWTTPHHIIKWNAASDDWHSPRAENDLQTGGKFLSRMESKDGKIGFDFEGTYTNVVKHKLIEYVMPDKRKVKITFEKIDNYINITETFDAENTHPVEMQRNGWQSILDNFKKYVENNKLIHLHFEINIPASAEKVYSTMIDEDKYKIWTAEFNPTSHYIGDWKKGSKMLFIGSDNEGNKGGMVSRIKENIPFKFISIEHLGILKGENEILSGPEVESWSGSLENYSFKQVNGHTLLSVDMDSNEEFKDYFMETWQKALNKLKSII